jgi:hypothetical protein
MFGLPPSFHSCFWNLSQWKNWRVYHEGILLIISDYKCVIYKTTPSCEFTHPSENPRTLRLLGDVLDGMDRHPPAFPTPMGNLSCCATVILPHLSGSNCELKSKPKHRTAKNICHTAFVSRRIGLPRRLPRRVGIDQTEREVEIDIQAKRPHWPHSLSNKVNNETIIDIVCR